MSTRVLTLGLSLLLGTVSLIPASAPAWQVMQSAGFNVTDNFREIEVLAGSSRRLNFEFNIPELQVENPEVVRATCVSPSQINLSGVKPGVSTITISDASGNLHSMVVNVVIDTRKLELVLKQHFVDSAIEVTALQNGVMLSGYVARSEDINNVLQVTQDYFPSNVVNQLRVDGSQIVSTEVRVYEVSRTKLRNLGIDWAGFGPNGRIVSGFSDVIANFTDLTSVNQTFAVSVFDDTSGLSAILNALEQRNVAKLMSQPTLISQNGRPAEVLAGGEIPIQVNVGLGTNSIQFRAFGTKLDVVPIVHGQGDMTLEVRAEVSEVAPELAGNTGVPGFRVRRVNTSAPMRAGQTLVLAGVYSEISSAESKGAPGLGNKPVIGAFFRNVQNRTNETELVFLLTPRTAAPMDSIPANLPGRSTQDPSNYELYANGYLEVPKCDVQCPESNPFTANQQQIQGPAPTQQPPMDPQSLYHHQPQDPLYYQEQLQQNPVPPTSGFVPPNAPVTRTELPSTQTGPVLSPTGYQSEADYFRNSSPPPSGNSRFGFPETSSTENSVLSQPTRDGSSRNRFSR